MAEQKIINAIDVLRCLTNEIITAVAQEKKSVEGLAVAFAEKLIKPLQELAGVVKDEPGGRMFWAQVERLRAELITSGDTMAIKEPYIAGGLAFQNKVKTILKTLPFEIQRFVGRACTFHEIGRDAKYAAFISTLYGVRTIAIAAGLNDQRLKETVFHEIAHAVLQHQSGGQFEEAMADIKMREWLH